jgi:hypothetical protein
MVVVPHRSPKAAAAALGGSRQPCRTPAARQAAAQAQHHLHGSSCSFGSWSCQGQVLAAAAGQCRLRRHLQGCSLQAGGLAVQNMHNKHGMACCSCTNIVRWLAATWCAQQCMQSSSTQASTVNSSCCPCQCLWGMAVGLVDCWCVQHA